MERCSSEASRLDLADRSEAAAEWCSSGASRLVPAGRPAAAVAAAGFLASPRLAVVPLLRRPRRRSWSGQASQKAERRKPRPDSARTRGGRRTCHRVVRSSRPRHGLFPVLQSPCRLPVHSTAPIGRRPGGLHAMVLFCKNVPSKYSVKSLCHVPRRTPSNAMHSRSRAEEGESDEEIWRFVYVKGSRNPAFSLSCGPVDPRFRRSAPSSCITKACFQPR